MRTLLHALRDGGDLAVKAGCEEGHCGACIVLVDGRPRYACLTLADDAAEATVETAGTLAGDRDGRAVVAALTSAGAVQCGYCTPGLVASLTFLARQPLVTRDDVVDALEAHHCRCTGYYAILRAAEHLF
ncbi:MAG: 2Fe-2S iron-sulfur cluster binding domain-containing protein [Actinobacteria bacterium]|nr:2Fe-2S iron-sulfur cluster binding domain-containing protein [Actinomycetota bacterium]